MSNRTIQATQKVFGRAGMRLLGTAAFMLPVAGLMLCPAAAAAEPGASPPRGSEDVTITGKRLDRDKLVCNSDVTTGSIIPKRVCKTKSEWEEERQRGLVALERLKNDQSTQRYVNDAREILCEGARRC